MSFNDILQRILIKVNSRRWMDLVTSGIRIQCTASKEARYTDQGKG